jgi:DNA-3-methyladenine glycosylase I
VPHDPSLRLRTGADGVPRCWWCGDDPLYVEYHDREWGRLTVGDVPLFEKFCLEGFQSGLSWITVLRKRPAFRVAFAGFDLEQVASFGEADVRRLLGDAGIIRHRGKIESAVNNARRALDLLGEYDSLFGFVSGFADHRGHRVRPTDELRATSPESVALSRELKRRGWTFVGPTTMYAFLQAMGLVDDHVDGCAVDPGLTGPAAVSTR